MVRWVSGHPTDATPLPELRTERLVLRPWVSTDLAAMAAMDSHPDVYEYLEGEPPGFDYSKEQREWICAPYGPGLGVWSIVSRQNHNHFIGLALLIPLGGKGPEIELGFRLVRAEWGRGMAQEAARAVIEHGFRLGLPKIVAVTDPNNLNSERTLRRLGFRRHGWRRAWGWRNHYFRLKRGRWLNSRPENDQTPEGRDGGPCARHSGLHDA
ncbi:GNAT family N-acetyltransferase [Citricoccus sp. CH26A]|uniref:GNAT family N-acetyltransferase n=1 Tax=Citricoccus TaxID=169133 RepID=UPI000A026294|nr:GNAT family N-acetyltransferase [Citricoccus sp. CH26A]